MGPGGPEELERLAEAPEQTLARGVERVRALMEAITRGVQAGVDDIRTLFILNRAINRAVVRIERLAPVMQKYQEAQAKEAEDRKRIADMIARLEADPDWELDKDEVSSEQ